MAAGEASVWQVYPIGNMSSQAPCPRAIPNLRTQYCCQLSFHRGFETEKEGWFWTPYIIRHTVWQVDDGL